MAPSIQSLLHFMVGLSPALSVESNLGFSSDSLLIDSCLEDGIVLLQRSIRVHEERAVHSDTVSQSGLIMLMRTGAEDSEDRLKAINETWAHGFIQGPQSRIVTLADQPAIAAECFKRNGDNHARGLTCLESENELKLLERGDFEWVFIIDDDVYVHIPNLEAKIASLDPNDAKVWGLPGCGECGERGKSPAGLCGGGGYLISRQNLKRMAGSKDKFLELFNSEPFQSYADVRFGCVAREHGMELVRLPGLIGNIAGIDDEEVEDVYFEHSIALHPVLPHLMRSIHARFTAMSNATSF